jgi:hypothetical protein
MVEFTRIPQLRPRRRPPHLLPPGVRVRACAVPPVDETHPRGARDVSSSVVEVRAIHDEAALDRRVV